ncbi:Hypothetical predicted protein, partial [Paramuricea clavata]
MAENLPKLQASRAGYRAHLTQTIKKATNIATKEDPLTDSDITSLKRIVDQLARKRSILEEPDEKIVGMIEDPKELEREIFQTEDIKEEIDETAAQISNIIEHFQSTKLSQMNTNDQTDSGTPNEIVQQDNSPPVNTQSQQDSQPSTNAQSHLINQNSRLPKLNLPTFSGNPLQWFTFWDSFEAAVHSNSTLGDVQKFSYLKAQLERFGNPTKVINAHMQCLLDLQNPNYELASLQLFYDTMENHIRGTNLARDHDSPEWKFTQLRESIRKEIRILEA